MGYQNKRHAAKLFQTESFFIDSANSLERDVFDCLCDMTPDPQNRPPYRDVPDTANGPGSCHDIVPVPPPLLSRLRDMGDGENGIARKRSGACTQGIENTG